MRNVRNVAIFALVSAALGSAQEAPKWDRKHEKAIAELSMRWWLARPATKFDAWDATVRAELEAEARALGPLPDGKLDALVELLWAPVPEFGPGIPKPASGKRGKKSKVKRPKWLPKLKKPGRKPTKRRAAKGKGTLDTPYGEAWFWADDPGGKERPGLILGLHGGGEGAGSADEPRGTWRTGNCIGFYPQGIRLVHDTWNTVHGERFLLTLIEIAKAHWDVDPDRVYSMGFSMGGSGSWFMAGRHADLLAGAAPCAGVLMADPKSQLERKEDVRAIQHGLLPNVRNLAMYYYIGLADRNCMPGTYLFAADELDKLRANDPGGYENITFKTIPGLAHAHPPGEPKELLATLPQQRRTAFPDTIVWETATSPFPLRESSDKVERLPKTWFYWLRCDELEDAQRIRASLDREKNEITLQVQRRAAGTAGITIYLNERMIDVQRPVVVRSSDGRELYSGKPTPDVWTVLESLDARLDRVLVFDRRIEL